ncbi:MAG: CoA transferase [Actinobacteria bacterium TMED270]|nr:MAG: CoA transferase [Actinobacteria bacterium TMED270]|tara:strand:+ start:332 stop:1555 length:1224 start_codon:yes stop_codon:yes gene_type:complete
MTAPLDGIRVIEFANFAAAPSATAIMADLGAEVIKVEAIGGDPIRGLMKQANIEEGEHNPDHPFQFINRGKKGIELNLDTDSGADIARRLVSQCDVVVMNLLKERRQRFGLDTEDLFSMKPDLVIGLLSGYGEVGEEINRPGYDVTAFFSRSGVFGGGTAPGSPPPHARPGSGDHTTSIALFGAVMAGLRSRDVTGEGQVVEASLLRTATWTISLDLVTSLIDGKPAYDRPREKGLSAMLEAFQASDHRWLQFAMPDTGDAWQRFCMALDREDLLSREEFSTGRLRYQNMAELLATLEESIGSKPADYWMPRLDEHKCIWAPINDSASAVQDPQVRATGAFETISHPVVGDFETVAAPFRMHDSPEVHAKGPAPEKGQHTTEVLQQLLHLSEVEIAELESDGVVRRG